MHQKHISAGVVVSSVGCLTQACIRDASGIKTKTFKEKLEIISLNGTISKNDCHLHISVADKNLKAYGGHLKDGCLVNTTAEIILFGFHDTEFLREYDEKTGYKELVIKEIKK